MKVKFCMLGNPGTGKDYLSNIINENTNIPFISGGNIAKHISKNNSVNQKQIQNGELISNQEITKTLFEIVNIIQCKNLIINGFPRSKGQLIECNKHLKFYKNELNFIYLYADQNILVERISKRLYCSKCYSLCESKVCKICLSTPIQRADDKYQDKVIKRIQMQDTLNKDLIRYISELNMNIIHIDTCKNINCILSDVLEYINKFKK